jgi:hypothetical protein
MEIQVTNDKGKQFLLRVTAEHVAKGQGYRNSCSLCPAANALAALFSTRQLEVRSQPLGGRTAYVNVRQNDYHGVEINSDALEAEIHKFDSGGSFTPGLYLCEVV